jgi:cytochrome c oxidase assembly protein subunit 11
MLIVNQLRRASRGTQRSSFFRSSRQFSNGNGERLKEAHKKVAYYSAGIVVFVFGLSYASVPLYKAFCQMTGFGGTTQRADEAKSSTVKPVEGGRIIRVNFVANVHSTMPWKFKPTQRDVRVVPGETALAFYTVTNPTDKAITGVATYNVHPPKAGLYFNKIQCFCFEEQRIAPKEEIDMPVFFFIDPDFLKDPSMDNVTYITLSYTFFKTDEDEDEVLQVPINTQALGHTSSNTAHTIASSAS